jgi:DNA-directed RNA polymerase sigma subunit (sigma70/sigma32)
VCRSGVSQTPFSDATWRRALAERSLVATIAKDFLGHGLDHDELIDEGLIGVCRAVETYHNSMGKWSVCAFRHAKIAIKEAVYRSQLVRRPWRVLWRAKPAGGGARLCGGRAVDLLPARGDRIPPGEWARAEAALARLDDQERAVIAGRFGLDGPERTLREIGTEIGRDRRRVAQMERAAIAKLRRAVGGA